MSKHVSLFRSFALAAALVAGSGAAFAQQAAPAPAPADGPTVEQVMKTPFLPSHIAAATEVLKSSGMMTMFENALPNVVGALRVNVTRLAIKRGTWLRRYIYHFIETFAPSLTREVVDEALQPALVELS